MKLHPRLSLLLATAALTLPIALTGCGGSASAPDPSSTADDAEMGNAAAHAVKVGDCRLEGATGLPEDAEVVPCAEEHDEEIFHGVTARGETFSIDSIDAATPECAGEAFTAFVGVPREESALSLYAILPTAETWDQPDGRVVFCVLFDPAGPVVGSLEGAAR
ncbi:hypothetical protein [Microbacterium paraoxydans]|uniref:hypothetical protein n=1 Tax=Microbacterium paraoxydans TaxID=199592 RepID=UPI001CFC11B0|nr:hypothetical protein [Microbacterium paraoxydans]